MQRAYVLSGDTKSLGILHQIFEELAVVSEQSNELATAIKKVSTEAFDVVLVDCDDLQMATHVFGILRGSAFNHGCMTIAAVDGKAGVPTAFRLGAKMVLSKPLSLEQARTTLRSALAVQRRDAQENKTLAAAASATASSAPSETVAPAGTVESEPNLGKAAESASSASKPVSSSVASSHAAAAAPAREDHEAAVAPLESNAPPATINSDKSISEKPRNAPQQKSSVEPPSPQIALVSREERKSAPAREPAPPSFAMLGEKQSKSKREILIAAAAVLLVVAGAVIWITQPNLRNDLLAKYGQLTHHNPAPNPAPVVSSEPTVADAQVAPAATQPAPAAEPTAVDPSTLAQGFQDNPPNADATATAPTAADNAEPVVVPEDLAAGHMTHRVAAWYPTKARQAHIKGNVVLTAVVAADGTIQSVTATKGNQMLRLAAEEAVKQWQYQTYYQNGQPVVFQTQATVSFPDKTPSRKR